MRLPRMTPAQAGLDPRCILKMIDRMEQEHINPTGFMLLRHGKVLCEGHYAPYTPALRRTVFSLSKTFTSMAVGIAWGEGKIDLDERLVDVFRDELQESGVTPGQELNALTIRHLLTMSTGQENEPFRQKNAWAHMAVAFLKEPFSEMPGQVFRYNTAATYMLSAALKKKGIDLESYLEEKLLGPLGISGTRWQRDEHDICAGGFGFSLTLETIARLGTMILQDGMWEGRQLVPAAYLREASRKQISNGDDPHNNWAQGYGFQMWMCPYGAFRGDGMYGQLCVMHRETDTVLAMTAVTGDMAAEMNCYYEEILNHYQPAPLPEDEAAMADLTRRLAALRFARIAPEDDGTPIPQAWLEAVSKNNDVTLTLEENGLLTIGQKRFGLYAQAARGAYHTINRAPICEPLHLRDAGDTPVMAAYGMKDGKLVIDTFELEFLEGHTLVLELLREEPQAPAGADNALYTMVLEQPEGKLLFKLYGSTTGRTRP